MKDKRQIKILELIESQIILTQEDLQTALQDAGFEVTQSTISRDIKELRLVKGHDRRGNYRYIAPDSNNANGEQPFAHYRELIKRSVKSVDYAMNNVVIKCYVGMASSTCVAVDALYYDQMLGSLAGDDTVLVVTRSEKDADALVQEIKKMI
ncbi:MAG: ArgR family transcriptional regulator [Clostridia bacterium]|nr:ArgR family transcriptional regulator [Clostridia bacterium]